jgi:type VI secretion system secreted protein VgrG
MVRALSQNETSGLKVTGPFDSAKTYFVSAKIEEGLSQVTRARLIIAILGTGFSLDKLLGEKIRLEMKVPNGNTRIWRGTCVEAEFLGTAGAESDGGRGYDVFALELRAWPFFLMLARDNRIFQDKSAPDVVKAVCNEHGFSDIRLSLSGTYRQRVYTVQYDETDYDFVNRLMEEEGIFWFIDHTTEVETLVLADSVGACAPIKETPEIEYTQGGGRGMGNVDKIIGWNDFKRAVPTKASLVDYNFTTPTTSLAKTFTTSGKPYLSGKEAYRMHGRYGTTGEADHYAQVMGERQAHPYERWAGSSTVRTMAAGATFKLTNHPRVTGGNEFLVLTAEHRFQLSSDGVDVDSMRTLDIITAETDDDICMIYENRFEVILKTVPYRPPALTPWPDMSGVHTAVVTGPSGEEIYTDKYSRIKVQFHWDRDGRKDERTTCWVPVMHPWTGKGFGMVSIPRIGNEVVIAFERNNPDRPMCIGMLYNETNMPPYALPANMTQTTVRTKSSKDEQNLSFNELVFEDKKDAEFVRLQSEKDYFEIIKNNATITIGLEKQDAGDMSLTVHHNLTETIKTGDHTYTVETGSQINTIQTDQTTTIKKGNQTWTIDEGNQTTTIRKGNQDTTISQGNQTTKIAQGNQTTEISAGNQTTKISAGKGEITAAQSFEIKVGSSSIKLEPAKITIKAMQIVLDADLTLEAKGGLTAKVEGGLTGTFKGGVSATLDGGAMATVKGGIVKIN